MKRIYNPKLLNQYISELALEDRMDIGKADPCLCFYEKGELLSGPYVRQQYLLIIASGQVQIYGIRSDGRKIPVSLARKGGIIGDVEFCQSKSSNLFSEAAQATVAVGIPIEANRAALEQDVRFLLFLLESVSSKVYLTSLTDSPPVSVEERLIHYMQTECEDRILAGVENAALRLGCSRRQLQRTLKAFCESGEISKTAKGHYRLNITD